MQRPMIKTQYCQQAVNNQKKCNDVMEGYGDNQNQNSSNDYQNRYQAQMQVHVGGFFMLI